MDPRKCRCMMWSLSTRVQARVHREEDTRNQTGSDRNGTLQRSRSLDVWCPVTWGGFGKAWNYLARSDDLAASAVFYTAMDVTPCNVCDRSMILFAFHECYQLWWVCSFHQSLSYIRPSVVSSQNTNIDSKKGEQTSLVPGQPAPSQAAEKIIW
jgi:hypothetical protein